MDLLHAAKEKQKGLT